MQMERQLRAGGGLMTLEEPRQGFFLGKIVKKAKRAVKKVVKSPIGKIALAATAANFAPMLLGKGTLLQQAGGFSGLPGLFARSKLGTGLASGEGMLGQLGNLFKVGGKKDNPFSLFRIGGGLLGAGAIAAPFLMGGDDEEDIEPETPFTETPASISNIVEQARNRDASLRYLPEPEFVARNFYRMANGGLADLRPGFRIGGGVLQKAGQMIKSGVGKVRSLFDDADINVSVRDEDVMTDFGPQAQAVGQDVFITPKSRKAVKVMDDLIEEGYDITKAEDGSYSINALDEGALDIVTQRLRIGSKGADDFIASQDYFTGGETGMMDSESKMIYDALRNRKAEGGLMDLGGFEKDYRTGGFVELGAEERADDVPARLSKNEFVFTADAVRNAGGGDIDKGAEVMQNMMDNLEAGGMISEESQGMNPAQDMFDQAQMLEGRLA